MLQEMQNIKNFEWDYDFKDGIRSKHYSDSVVIANIQISMSDNKYYVNLNKQKSYSLLSNISLCLRI